METRGSCCGDKPRGWTRDHGKTGPAASTGPRPKVGADMGVAQAVPGTQTRAVGLPKRMWRRNAGSAEGLMDQATERMEGTGDASRANNA